MIDEETIKTSTVQLEPSNDKCPDIVEFLPMGQFCGRTFRQSPLLPHANGALSPEAREAQRNFYWEQL